MPARRKDKTIATLLASAFGGLGAHRFYLYGKKDAWGWIHLACAPLAFLFWLSAPERPLLFSGAPLAISALAGFIEALVIGLTPDEKWDAAHNPAPGHRSESGWPLAIMLVLTVGIGSTALIAAIARLSDLFITGGAYG